MSRERSLMVISNCLTGPGFVEAVLLVRKDIMEFEVVHDTAMHNMLHYSATNRGEGALLVVGWICLVSFLKDK